MGRKLAQPAPAFDGWLGSGAAETYLHNFAGRYILE
jgi:hypothetical protein